MSKRNKRKNKHQFQSRKKEAGQSSEGVVESKPVTLDEHLDDLELQSMKVSNHDSTVKEVNDVTSGEVQKEFIQVSDSAESKTKEDKEKVEVKKLSEVETGGKSNKTVKAFVWGLLIGALIVSVLF